MANLAVTTSAYLNFDNTSPFTTGNFDTTGLTWACLVVNQFTADLTTISAVKYNTSLDITATSKVNTATAHISAGVMAVYLFVPGANAGNHPFTITWSSGNYLDVYAFGGTGDLDAAILDTAIVQTEETDLGTSYTVTPLTPNTTNALPLVTMWPGAIGTSVSAASGCTKIIASGLSPGTAGFYCPLFSGSATAPVINQAGAGFAVFFSWALKPPAAAGSVGATTGTGTAAAIGASTFAGVAAATGTGTAAAVSAATFAAVAAASGIGTAAATSAGVHTLTLTNNVPYFTGGDIYNYKQTLGTTTDVVVAGLYSGGTPTHIEYQLGGAGSYTTVGTEVIGAGAWSGKILAQAAGDQTLKLRWSNDTATNLTTLLSVGINILILGDSEATDPNTSAVTPSGTPFHVRYQHSNTEWVDWDTTPEFEQGQWAYFGEQVTAGQSAPCFVLNKAASGSSFSNWGAGQTDLNDAIAVATALFSGGIHGVMMCNLGTNDARQSSTLTAAGVKTTIDSICTAINAVLPGGAAPIYWTAIAEIDANVGGGNLRTEMDAVRGGLVLSVAGGACRMGPFLQDLDYTVDNLHPDTNDLPIIGRRQYLEITDTLFGTSVGYGPRVSSLTLDVTKTIVVVNLDLAISNSLASSVVGFQVSDSGTPVTISSQVVTTSTSITLTLAAPIAGTCTVTWTSNNDATGQTVPMRPTETLPTGATVGRPMELFFNQATIASGVAVGVAVGAGTATGFSNSSVATSSGIGIALGVGASTFSAVANAAGQATVQGVSGGVTAAFVPQLRLRRSVLPM